MRCAICENVCDFYSSLSSVEPPEVFFTLKLPQETIDGGKLSSLQLESIVYTCQQHMNILPDSTRAGFLVGRCGSNGASVGCCCLGHVE